MCRKKQDIKKLTLKSTLRQLKNNYFVLNQDLEHACKLTNDVKTDPLVIDINSKFYSKELLNIAQAFFDLLQSSEDIPINSPIYNQVESTLVKILGEDNLPGIKNYMQKIQA